MCSVDLPQRHWQVLPYVGIRIPLIEGFHNLWHQGGWTRSFTDAYAFANANAFAKADTFASADTCAEAVTFPGAANTSAKRCSECDFDDG